MNTRRICYSSSCFYLALISLFLFSVVTSYSQEDRLAKKTSLLTENQTIVDVIQIIEYESGVSFSYNSKLITKDIRINIDIDDKSIRDVLNEVFNQTNLEFRELNNVIVVYRPRKLESDIKDGIVQISITNDSKVQTIKKTDELADLAEGNKTENDKKDDVKKQSKLFKIKPLDAQSIKSDKDRIIDTREVTKYKAKRRYYDNMKLNPFYKKLYYELELFGGVNYLVSYSTTSPNTLYLDTYEKQTSSIPGYDIGAYISVHYRSNFLQSGIGFSMNRERYNHTNTLINILSQENISDIPYNTVLVRYDYYWQISGNDSTRVPVQYDIDTTIIVKDIQWDYDTNTVNTQQEYINKRAYLEIPLIYGSRIYLNRSLSFDLRAGLVTSILIYNKSHLMSSNDIGLVEEIDKKYYYSTGFSMLLSPGINLQINRKFSFNIDPAIKIHLRSVYNKQFPVKQKEIDVGLRTGLTYYF